LVGRVASHRIRLVLSYICDTKYETRHNEQETHTQTNRLEYSRAAITWYANCTLRDLSLPSPASIIFISYCFRTSIDCTSITFMTLKAVKLARFVITYI
jgi:hypothetical protein